MTLADEIERVIAQLRSELETEVEASILYQPGSDPNWEEGERALRRAVEAGIALGERVALEEVAEQLDAADIRLRSQDDVLTRQAARIAELEREIRTSEEHWAAALRKAEVQS